jgi:hypothetical protein
MVTRGYGLRVMHPRSSGVHVQSGGPAPPIPGDPGTWSAVRALETTRQIQGAPEEEFSLMITVLSAHPAARLWVAIAAAALVLTLGIAPLLSSGADHLDAPSLGRVSVDAMDNLSVSKVRGPLDINDVYVFDGSAATTALVMTVNPAVNLIGPATFAAGAEYALNIDWSGDAVADSRLITTFGDPDARGVQHYTVKRDGQAIASGFTDTAKGKAQGRSGAQAFAGIRSDPFFFDLIGFLGSVKHQGTDSLGNTPSDFFIGLNTMAIVVEVPNAMLGGNGTSIGVWATTSLGGAQADQMGRPAINTVFNGTAADKELFNLTAPANQPTAAGGKFRTNVINTLVGLSTALGDPYTAAQAGGIATLLLPDVMTYTVGTDANFLAGLNGRDLDDDVIDLELAIATNGVVPSDLIGPHADITPGSFPYLGNPHP